jgi:hypothetical protein
VPDWYRTRWLERGVCLLGVEKLRIADDLRQARDSETAHLEAVLKDSGAKALRLARVKDVLRARGLAAGETFDLKIAQGVEPRLWLDLRTSVAMRPDAGTYQLTVHGREKIEVVLETKNLDEIVAECSRHLAHAEVVGARAMSMEELMPAPASQAKLIFVWMLGVFTGVAVLALCAILLKLIHF